MVDQTKRVSNWRKEIVGVVSSWIKRAMQTSPMECPEQKDAVTGVSWWSVQQDSLGSDGSYPKRLGPLEQPKLLTQQVSSVTLYLGSESEWSYSDTKVSRNCDSTDEVTKEPRMKQRKDERKR